MEQSAVDWLIEELKRIDNTFEKDSTDYTDSLRYAKDIAEEMEKKQIIDAWDNGYDNGFVGFVAEFDSAKQYYNEIFKNK
jgi:hypothetical protein